MKLVYALLLIAPSLSFAQVSEAEIENMYHAICQPHSTFTQSLSQANRNEANQIRPEFLAFLSNPAPIVTKLKHSALFQTGSGLETLEAMFSYAATCVMAELLEPRIEQHGCSDLKTRHYSAKKAVKLCAPLTQELKRLQAEHEAANEQEE